jgi:hypothetical protein
MATYEIPHEELKQIFGGLRMVQRREGARGVANAEVLVEQVWDQVQALELPYPRELFNPVSIEKMRHAFLTQRSAKIKA